MDKLKLACVHNFATHYTVTVFQILARYFDVDFFFFSRGEDWFWLKEHGVESGLARARYLDGFHIGRTRITLSLPYLLWKGGYALYLKCINGRFAVPATYLVARCRAKPFVLWTGIWCRLQTRFHRIVFPVTRYIYRHADAIITYGEHVKRYLISEGVPAERIFVAPHAVDNSVYGREVPQAERDSLLSSLNIPPEQRIVLYLGRLERIKGLDYLIDAFASLNRRDAVLVLAGTGSETSRLQLLARQKRLGSAVRFAGYVPKQCAPAYYACAWTYVLPSITLPTGKELWGLVVNEAFNQGLPVIATGAVGAVAGGLVRDGVNGFVVPERDSAALANALRKILDDPAERMRLSNHARESVRDWDQERMVAGICEAIQYALSRSRSVASFRRADPLVRCRPPGRLSCGLCGGNTSLFWKPSGILKCRSCGLLCREVTPSQEALAELYGAGWADPAHNESETGGTDLALARKFANRLARSLSLESFAGLKLLDFGAGTGAMLGALAELGAEVHGVEPFGYEYLRHRDFHVYRSLDEIPAGIVFDGVITMNVIEHIPRPWEAITGLRQKLKPGGWLLVSSPNSDGLNARLHRSNWREAKKAGHLLLFNPSSLELLLRRCGYHGCRRLHWLLPYGNGLAIRDYCLQSLWLDGELKYLAFENPL